MVKHLLVLPPVAIRKGVVTLAEFRGTVSCPHWVSAEFEGSTPGLYHLEHVT